MLQRCSHILYRLFYPFCADHFQGAAHRHTPGKSFLQAPDGLFRGGDVPVTGDDDVAVAVGGEPADHPHVLTWV